MNFPQFLERKFLEWQQKQGERKTVAEFARWIGVKQSSVSMWWNGVNTPSGESVRLLSQKLGLEVYDALGLPRPNENLSYLERIWDNLKPEHQRALKEQAEKYVTRTKKD